VIVASAIQVEKRHAQLYGHLKDHGADSIRDEDCVCVSS